MLGKTILPGGFTALAVVILVWLYVHAHRQESVPIGATMPVLRFLTPRGTAELQPDSGMKTLVMYFHSNCEHCKYELWQLDRHAAKFAAIKLVFLTSEPAFFDSGIIEEWPALRTAGNVVWGIVDRQQFKRTFGVTATPYLFFFDEEGTLFNKMRGEVKPGKVLQLLKTG
jgi:thioredoxin-related protein